MSKVEISNVLPKVKAQYEDFPYPARNPQSEKEMMYITSSSQISKVNHMYFNGKQNFDNFRYLVAGGGTGDAAISMAEQLRNRNAEIVYLDMSSTSMNIAKERANIRKLDNITWINDSLLNLPKIDIGKFDLIDCSGVLHHLKDPDEGLRALKSVLKPDGIASVMVYARYGRSAIYIMQELMRMVNIGEPDPENQVLNAKKILSSQPSHNLFNILQGLQVWRYNDTQSDAGIYDLLLHSQDRAYTILEVHDWLERCGMTMVSEPGAGYEAKHYMPETYITDKKLLELIHSYPIKIQQAIGEAMSTYLAKHTFFCSHEGIGNREAKLTDPGMYFYRGNNTRFDLSELATMALQRNETFTVTYNLPNKPEVEVPHGKYIPTLLNQMNKELSVVETIEAVKNSPRFKDKKIDEELLMQEMEILLKSLRRADILFLRHESVTPYENIPELQRRVSEMYNK